MITARDLQTIFIVLYDNNPQGYNSAFIDAGYPVPANANSAKRYVVRLMYDLYFSNPAKLQSIMNGAGWNPNAGNYTTSGGDLREILLGYLKEKIVSPEGTAKINLAQLQDWLFGNQTTVTNQTVTEGSVMGAWAGVVGGALLAVISVWFASILMRNFKGNKKATIGIVLGAVVLILLAGFIIYRSGSKIVAGSSTTTSTSTGHGGVTDLLGNASGFLGGWWSSIFGGGNQSGFDNDNSNPAEPG